MCCHFIIGFSVSMVYVRWRRSQNHCFSTLNLTHFGISRLDLFIKLIFAPIPSSLQSMNLENEFDNQLAPVRPLPEMLPLLTAVSRLRTS